MAGQSSRWWFPGAFCALFLLAAGPSRGEEGRLAISGYDPVAYFTDAKPIEGLQAFEHIWHNARWRFATAAHRDMFVSDPERYAPQFDGYCAMGAAGVAIAAAHKDSVDPEAWAIVDGKLYLTHTKASLEKWRENARENIKRGEQQWQFVKDQADPVFVGTPCRKDPPTVIVTTINDKRKLIIGRQVALDESGKVVGKGDIRAQLEQVGKNIDTCLRAGGATEADIVFTRTYVSETAAPLMNASMRSRYLGPEGPDHSLIEQQNFAGPDFLIGVEAVAALK
jgi:enamine deaminase RidA (YjgF/YER057c/UK114 family)